MSNKIARIDDDDAPIFPPGVIIEILTRLPVETLVQLQLVCKDWQSMIYDHSYFKELHMNHTKITLHWHNRVMTAEERKPGQDLIYLLDCCDGLLLLKKNTEKKQYWLWNPATRRVLVLPDPHEGTLGIAFSFVPATKSYRIVSFYKDNISGGELGCEVLIPGQSDDVWRRLNNFPKITYSPDKKEKVSVVLSGGAVHCVAVTKVGEETNTEIVSLELGTGNFTVNHIPKLVVGRWLDWDGKLAIANVVGQNLEVTELEDYKKRRWCEEKKIIGLPFLKGKANVEVFPLFASLGNIWFWLKGEKVFTYTIATGKQTDIYHYSKTIAIESKFYPYKPSMICFRGMVPDTNVYRNLLDLS